ncbi:MAG: sigma-70 family RNA polymerase sigma factor [Planctomycetota bacterium]
MDRVRSHPDLERLLTHQDWLRALARKLVGDAQAADDLVQETWIAALKSPPDPDRPARPWLAGVVRRLASMRARGEGRRARRQNEVALRDELPSTADLVEEVDTQRRLVGEVLQLSEPYRTTVMLRYFQNMSSAEIARHQDVPPGTVRWRLKRGLDELRERLDDSFGSRENWCLALVPLARFGIGSGASAAGAATGTGTILGGIGAFKVVAGMLALISGLYFGPMLLSRLRMVFAAERHAELISNDEVNAASGTAEPVRVALQGNDRNLVAPTERRVRFLDPGREPIVGMQVVLDDHSPAPPVAWTDAEGLVSFTTALTRATLYVRREGTFVQPVDVQLTAKGVDTFLPWNAELSGRVLAGSQLALADLELAIDSDVRLWGETALPEPVAQHFADPAVVHVTTDAAGAFTVGNLPATWSGKVWLPQGVAIAGADRRDESGRYAYFAAPQAHAMLAVRQLPRVSGRVLGGDGRSAQGARVRCWADGAETPVQTLCDATGRFEFLLDSDGTLGLRVEADDQEGAWQVRREIAGQAVGTALDLGDLELRQALEVQFRALTIEEEPVEGPGGMDGRTAGGAGQRRRRVGHGASAARHPGVPHCRGRFRIRGAEGPAGRGTRASGAESRGAHRSSGAGQRGVVHAFRLAAGDRGTEVVPGVRVRSLPPWIAPRWWADSPDWKRDLRAPALGFVADGSGRLEIAGIEPGVALSVEVLDRLGETLYSQRIAGLLDGEQRKERIQVPDRLHAFHGYVRDRSGTVLVDVEVSLQDIDGRRVSARSGLDGHVGFADLVATQYAIHLQKRGFVSVDIPDFSILNGPGSSSDQPAEFVLDRGTDLAILVIDGEDQPVTGGQVQAVRRSDGKAFRATPAGAADQTLLDLEQGILDVTLLLGGVRYTESVQSPLPRSVEFRVPYHGRAEVRWTLPEDLDPALGLRVLAVPLASDGTETPVEGRESVVTTIGARTGAAGVSEMPALLPGSYRLHLQGPSGEGSPEWVDLTAAQTLEVLVGQTAHAEFLPF